MFFMTNTFPSSTPRLSSPTPRVKPVPQAERCGFGAGHQQLLSGKWQGSKVAGVKPEISDRGPGKVRGSSRLASSHRWRCGDAEAHGGQELCGEALGQVEDDEAIGAVFAGELDLAGELFRAGQCARADAGVSLVGEAGEHPTRAVKGSSTLSQCRRAREVCDRVSGRRESSLPT